MSDLARLWPTRKLSSHPMIPEIDGLRCCAAVWIVLFHIVGSIPGRPATEAHSVAAAFLLEVLGVGAMSYTIYLYHYLVVLGLGRVVQSALGNDASLYALGLHCATVLGATILASALFFKYGERPFMDRCWRSRRAVAVARQERTLSISTS